MAAILKLKTTRPSLDSKFFFDLFIDWENRPWVEEVQRSMESIPGLIKSYLEEHISRDEIVARRNELPEELQFIADDCMDFEPEYHDPQQLFWPSWSADMSPPYNPFSLTHTVVGEFDTKENAENFYLNVIFADPGLENVKQLLAAHSNTHEVELFVDGVQVPITNIIVN